MERNRLVSLLLYRLCDRSKVGVWANTMPINHNRPKLPQWCRYAIFGPVRRLGGMWRGFSAFCNMCKKMVSNMATPMVTTLVTMLPNALT